MNEVLIVCVMTWYTLCHCHWSAALSSPAGTSGPYNTEACGLPRINNLHCCQYHHWCPALFLVQGLKLFLLSFCPTSLSSSALRSVLIQQLRDSVFWRSFQMSYPFLLTGSVVIVSVPVIPSSFLMYAVSIRYVILYPATSLGKYSCCFRFSQFYFSLPSHHSEQ